MSWLEIALWIGGGLLVGLVVLVALAITGLLGLAAYAESRAGDARPDDDTMALADGLGFQRAEAWTGSNVTVPRDRTRRLSEGWIAHAEREADWHALEYMATGKRAEVSSDGR